MGKPRRWTADDIRAWAEVRQLSLDAYLAGYEAGRKSALKEIYRILDGGRRDGPFTMDGWCRREAERSAFYDGCPAWGTLRRLVYERDEGTCQACGELVHPADYELGHLVDRMCGGLDTPENVVVMCRWCNQVCKPIHETREEALAWFDGRVLPERTDR